MGIATKLGTAFFLGALAWGPAWAAVESPAPQTPVQQPAKGKDWNGAVRVFFGVDNNVALVTESSSYNGDEGSPYLGFMAHGTYWKLDKGGWKGGIAGSLGRTVYTTGFPGNEDDDPLTKDEEEAPKQYNISVFNPRLFAKRAVEVGGVSAAVDVSYDFRWENLAIDQLGATHHRFSAKARVQPRPLLVVDVRLSRAHHNSKVKWPQPGLDRRDGRYQMIEVEGSDVVPAAKGRFILVYRRAGNDADGRNFDYSGNDFTFGYKSQLNPRMWLSLGVGKDFRSYKGFVSNFISAPGRDSMDVLKGDLRFLWKARPQIVVDLHIKSRSYEAQDPIFKGSRRIGGLGVTYFLAQKGVKR